MVGYRQYPPKPRPATGGAWLLMERPLCLGFMLAGGVCLVWGGVNLLRARRAATEETAD